jgi:hypothetical protein
MRQHVNGETTLTAQFLIVAPHTSRPPACCTTRNSTWHAYEAAVADISRMQGRVEAHEVSSSSHTHPQAGVGCEHTTRSSFIHSFIHSSRTWGVHNVHLPQQRCRQPPHKQAVSLLHQLRLLLGGSGVGVPARQFMRQPSLHQLLNDCATRKQEV